MNKYRNYLLRSKFKIHTDCSAFIITFRKKDLTSRIDRWSLLLEQFYCKVNRPYKQMQHVDALTTKVFLPVISNSFGKNTVNCTHFEYNTIVLGKKSAAKYL